MKREAWRVAAPTGPRARRHVLFSLGELRQLIEAVRLRAAEIANSVLTMLQWHVGSCIRRAVIKEARAECGQKNLPTLSAKMVS